MTTFFPNSPVLVVMNPNSSWKLTFQILQPKILVVIFTFSWKENHVFLIAVTVTPNSDRGFLQGLGSKLDSRTFVTPSYQARTQCSEFFLLLFVSCQSVWVFSLRIHNLLHCPLRFVDLLVRRQPTAKHLHTAFNSRDFKIQAGTKVWILQLNQNFISWWPLIFVNRRIVNEK